jgi:hypothetical protein
MLRRHAGRPQLNRDPLGGEMLLETRYKAKLPSGWSYPVGAALVSEHLQGATHFEDLDLSFHWSRDIARVADEDGVAVCRVGFSRAERGRAHDHLLFKMGYYDPKWRITVYAVPSVLKKAVRDALLESGFAAVTQWLGRKRPPTWHYGRKACSVVFVPSSGNVRVTQSE